MKGAVLALFCAVALVSAELNENGCPINPYVDILKPHPNCNKFYQCQQGELTVRNCAASLVFNEETQECDWPENVNCGDRDPVVPKSSEEDNSEDNKSSIEENSSSSESASESAESGDNGKPSEASEICAAEDSDGVLVPHQNCNKFYKCSEGKPVAFKCYGNLQFNPDTDQCDWPENVNCKDRNTDGGNSDNGNGDGGNGDGGNGDGDNEDSGKGDGGNGDNGDSDNGNTGGGNGNPSEAPKICAAEGSDGVLVAHENCNQFYKCSEGVPVALRCYGNLLFNPATDQCDWPENVNCEDRSTGGGNGDNGNGDGDNGDSDNGNTGGGNGNPSEAPKICAAEGSDGVLVAHENCNQFYKCSEGVPVALSCYGNLLFNPATDQCDWPENVNCEDRSTGGGNGDNGNGDGDNGDSDNGNKGGGNSNPSEAPEICAAEGSDGVLVANENCNQFYKCSDGVPVAMDCPLNLLYNPAKEQCDWPENVNCADRTPDSGDGDSESGAGGNGNPSKAPKICAAEGSDGVLVAHENCNQYYKCYEGVPLALSCYGDLQFNPAKDQCDWPENVNCGRRNILTSFNKHVRFAYRL